MALNRIYKVIWSKTKGCYVVVSEMAKRVGRNKAKAIVMSTAAMAMAVTPAVMNVDRVEAEVLIGKTDGTTISANGSTVNSWGITIGGGITNAGSHSVHVGDATLEEGERNVIIGTHATAGVDNGVRRFVRQSTAIGGGASANEGARAFGDQSIAIGANTIAEGNSSIAIGNDDVDRAVDKQIKYTNPDGVEETNNLGNAYNKLTGKNLLSDGGQYADTRSGEAAIAIGVKSEAGDISLALGTGAKAKKVNTVSIGTGATADLDNSVAIGGGAVADKDSQGTKQTSTTINGIIYKWAGGDTTNPGDVVSFGKPGFERQLKNIAAGEISSTSTDAINGSQIHSLVEKITGTPKLSYTTQDGTPVYKFGDKFYKVNEKGQRISAAGKPEVGTNQHGQLVDEDNNVIEPIDSATTPLKTALVNSSPEAGKTGTTSPTALNNITSNLVNFDAPIVNGKVPAKNTLRNLVNNAVSDDTVATVGDLRNMGWIVSADKTKGADKTVTDTAYSETVKNAEEVKFVGTGMAVVSGKTENGVRTITVDVQGGNTTAASPVVYTKADGTKVYPVEGPNGTTYHTTPEGKGPNDETVDGNDVITSVNGPRGTQTPSVLSNVAGNLEGAKPNSTAPTTSATAPTLGTAAGQVNVHNAATVGDVLNAGWNLQNNDAAKDFVKAYDTVNFVNGDGTTAVVETTDNTVSKIKYNVNTGNGLEKTTDNKIAVKPGDKSLDVTEAGVTVKKADQSLEVTDAGLKVKTDGTTITAGDNGLTVNTGTVNTVETGDKKGTVEVPTADAGKIATVDTVVKAVNSASFTLKASATTDGTRNANSTVDANGEAIKAGSTVELIAGKNLDVQHDTNGKITFATKDNVTFETVQVGGDQGPKLSKSDAGDIKVSGSDGTTPVKVTNVKDGDISANSKDAINGGQLHKLAKNTIKLAGKNGEEAATETDTQTLDKENGIAFTVKSSDGTLLAVTAKGDTITLTPKVGSITTDANGVPTADVTNGKLVTAEELVTALKGMGWKATAGQDGTGTVDGTTEELIKAGETVTFKAGDNLAVKQAGKEFIYSLQKELTGLTSAEFKNAAGDKTVINHDGVTITPADATKQPVSVTKDGLNNGGNQITNVTSGLVNHTEVDKHDLRNLTNTAVPDTTAATVGDLRNMGWVVSSNKTTGDLEHVYSATVKNANEVKFVGTGTAIVSGETKDGVRTITVNVDDQVSANNATTPVAYTKADGTKVYPIKGENGVITYHTTPDGKGDNDQEVLGTEVITSVNSPDGTTTPATLANVAGNLDGAKKDTMAPKTEAAAPNTTNKDGDKYINPNNAATVGDVLNAGWNLQENGTAKDFVKPYDTVNFINGANTTAVVTTSEDGSTSKVTYNVTGLPITYTTAEGKPVSKVGNKFYMVNEQGQPVTADGKPAVGTNADGKPVTAEGTVIEPIDTAAKPLQSNLVNPNVKNTDNLNQQTTTPTQLGNVANGADTYKPAADVKQANDGKWYNTSDVQPNGKPVDNAKPVASPLATKNANGDVLEKAKDGNWYKAADVVNGEPKPNISPETPVEKPKHAETAGLVNFENSKPNNAATVGDLQNLGFVLAAKDNGYTEQMRNANKVEFKGGKGVEVTGKTLEDGTREITVALKDGKVTNNVIITKADGTETHAVRGEDGKIYEKDPVTGKATTTVIPVAPTDTVTNDGDSYVTGNTVATAIQKSGWNIGIGSTAKEFSTEEKVHEKVNPNDNVKYVNGDNTTVSMAVDEAEDRDGTKVTTTYVKVDVNRDLNVDSITAGGPVKGKDGKDGSITVKDAKGKDGVSATAKDGKGTLTLQDANTDSKVDISTGKAPADLANTPKDGTPVPTMDRIQYAGKDGKVHNVATMNDGLRFVGDDDKSIDKPLNSTLTLTGGNREDTGKPVAKDATTTGNIGVFNTDGKLSIQLAKDLEKLNSANFESKADKAGNPLKKIGDVYYPENAKIIDGKVYPEGTVIIDNKPYPAGSKKDAAGNVVSPMGQPATEVTALTPITKEETQAGPTSTLTGTGLTFNTPEPKDENGKPLVLVNGKYYKPENIENGKPKADAKPEPVKPAQTTAFTPDGLVITPETAKVKDANGNPVYDEHGKETIDPKKVVSFGASTIVVDPKTGKPMVDPKTGEPVMKSGISAGGQVMSNVAQGVLDTDAVNVSQLKGVANAVTNVNNRMNRMGAQAAALASLQSIQYDPLEPTQISAGLGHYKGSSALALGVNHFKNESTMFHMGASLNGHGDETMVNASVTWKFGARADETAVKDTFRQGPISASYTLQNKVSALEEQNKIQKDQLNELRATNAAQKAENEAQREELALMKAQIAELFKRVNG